MTPAPIRIAVLDDVRAQAEKRTRWIDGRFSEGVPSVETKLFEYAEDLIADVEAGADFDVIVSDLFMFKKGPPRGDHHSADDGGVKVLNWLNENKHHDVSFGTIQLLWVSAQSSVNDHARQLQRCRDLDAWWDYVEDQAGEAYFLNRVERMISRIIQVRQLASVPGGSPDVTTDEGLVRANDLIFQEMKTVQRVPKMHRRVWRIQTGIPYLVNLFKNEEEKLQKFLDSINQVDSAEGASAIRWKIINDRFGVSRSYLEKLRARIRSHSGLIL